MRTDSQLFVVLLQVWTCPCGPQCCSFLLAYCLHRLLHLHVFIFPHHYLLLSLTSTSPSYSSPSVPPTFAICLACSSNSQYSARLVPLPSTAFSIYHSPVFLPHTLYSLRFENTTKYSTKQLYLANFGSSTTCVHHCNYATNGWLKVILTLLQHAKVKHYKARERRL